MTDQALTPILAGLRQRGLQPVRLSELLAAGPAVAATPSATAAAGFASWPIPDEPAAAEAALAWRRRADNQATS
jgi:hypothetical protein